ncbi:sodium-independent sulfate anion transporter-like isoform X1 [Schistocerca americana]|uniref:sodium-independent sulfate anion transporter-like isoform X1 n=2 Tax=Schistocerca americana TaxID=7009 RepID=UPI001F5032F8|nr:sodium-independent sulfate anion transporter-like isoform X1 [Schistocerca americana]
MGRHVFRAVQTFDYAEEAIDSGNDLNEATTCSVITRHMKEYAKDFCSTKTLKRRFPVIEWLPRYSWNYLLHDILAGFTVGLTAIPQGIAYAVVAGLEPQYGLYAGIMGAFLYIPFGSCHNLVIGPTAILALMVQSSVSNYGPDIAILLTFLTGCIIALLGLLHLGFLVDFISVPVTSAFTSAAALNIASSQLKGLLGIGGKSDSFLESWINVVNNIEQTQLWDVVLGVSTIIVLVFLQKINEFDKKRDLSGSGTARKAFSKALWFLSLGRNAIVAVIGTGLGYALFKDGEAPFKLTGDIGQGLPPFELPPFSTNFNNNTYNFSQMTEALGPTIATLPVVSILETVAIAKAFSKGKAFDATQELLALGICNIAGGFVRSMPITGSFTRTAVNNASGVKTTLGALFTGILILLALSFLTSTFYFIPKATLAGIIITAMYFMIDVAILSLLWKTKKLDLIPYIVTFFCCIFLGLEMGIGIGVGVNLLFLLYDSARPRLLVDEINVCDQKVLLLSPQQNLRFPSAEHIREVVVNICAESPPSSVVLNGSLVGQIDATVAKVLKLLCQDLKNRNVSFYLWRWNRQTEKSFLGIDMKMGSYFTHADTLEDIFKVSDKANEKGETVTEHPANSGEP